MFSSASQLLYHAKTAFLFTKADFTGMLPIVCLAVTATPLSSPGRLLHIFSWIWIHALALSLSNQTLDLAEDMLNKPYRPIPAGRISPKAAYRLRWIVPLMCFALSARYSSLLSYVSIVNCILVLLYDDCATSSHWFTRNLLNAAGHANVGVGACLLASEDSATLNPTTIRTILSSAWVILFTIHVQDFKDVVGDAAVGRQTIPIVFPNVARPTFTMLMVAVSVVLSVYWKPAKAAATAFIVLGSIVGGLFMMRTSKEADKLHFQFYMIWLTAAYMLPAVSHR